MNWWKQAEKDQSIEERIKHQIRSSPFFQKLFYKFQIPLEKFDDCKITIYPIEKSFAEAGEDEIIIDKKLADSSDFFSVNFHFLAHEIIHWLHRQKEKDNYFADPEEIEGFTSAMAYMLSILNGDNIESRIIKQFLPLAKIGIGDDAKSLQFVKERLMDAKKLLEELKCNYSS